MAGQRSTVPSALQERGVTRREAEVLDALGDRLTNAEIATRLYISERTVESHVSSLLRKLHAGDRLELGEVAKDVRVRAVRGRRPLPAAVELMVDAGPCVGRTCELASLRATWNQVRAGQTRVVLVEGEAGIGKSRLVAELALHVHDNDGQVLLGSCDEDLAIPFEPFAEALCLDAIVLVGVERQQVPQDVRPQAATFRGVVDRLTETAGLAPVLLVIEDLHWASASSLDLLRYVARAAGGAPILIVATARTSPPDLDEPLRLLMGDAGRLPAVERLELAGLGRDGVAEMLTAIGSHSDPEAVWDQSGGNPLFVRELAAGGAVGRTGSVSNLVARRDAILSETDRELIDLAAVAGHSFHADVLVAATGRGLVDILEGLERAEAAGLVVAVPGRPGMFQHRHAVFRAARYEGLTGPQRLRLHHDVAKALESDAVDEHTAADLARHACMAAPLGDPARAISHARRAAELADRAMAYDEASQLYRQALDVVPLLDPPIEKTRVELSIGLGRVVNRMGDERHRAPLLEAAAAARRLEDPAALADIAWAMSQGAAPHDPGRRDIELSFVAEEALKALPDPSATRARTLATLATDCWLGGERARGQALAREAIEVASRLDDPLVRGQVLIRTRPVRWVPGAHATNAATANELVAVGRVTGQTRLVVEGLAERAMVALEQGETTRFSAAVDALTEAISSLPLPFAYVRAQLIGFRCTRAVWSGDLDEAGRIAGEMTGLADGTGIHRAMLMGPLEVEIHHNRGRLAERLPALEAFAAEDRPGMSQYVGCTLALAYAHTGRVEDASRLMWSVLDEARPPSTDSFWLVGRLRLCETAEITGDREAGTELASELEGFGGVMAAVHHMGVAPVDLARAQAALAADDIECAEAIADALVDRSRVQRMPLFLGRALLRAAASRQRRGAPADTVHPLVTEAVLLAESSGAALIGQEAERLDLA